MGWGQAAQSPACPGPQDCTRGTASCVVFSCPLYSFDRAAVLHVWGRLWNSTFLEVRVRLGRWVGHPLPQHLPWGSVLLLPPSCPNAAHSQPKTGRNTLRVGHHSVYKLQELGGGGGMGAFRRRVSFLAPLGVLGCEVPGSDCPSQHHREVLHQELAAQRCLHSGELPGWGGGAGEALLSCCSSPCSLNPLLPRSQ